MNSPHAMKPINADASREAAVQTPLFRLALGIAALWCACKAEAAPFAYITSNTFNGHVRVIDLATHQVVGNPIFCGENTTGIAVNPAGTRVYAVGRTPGNGRQVSVIDTAARTRIAVIPLSGTPDIEGIAVHPSGTRAYVANYSLDSISLLDLTTNSVIGGPIAVGDGPYGVVLNPAGTRLYVTNRLGQSVSVLDTATNTVIATLPVNGSPQGIVVHPDGHTVYAARQGAASGVLLIDALTNTLLPTSITVIGAPAGLAINPAGTRLYLGNLSASTLAVIDTGSHTVIAAPAVGAVPLGIGVHPDGSRVYVVANNSNRVDVVETAGNTLLTSVPVGEFPVSWGPFVGPAAEVIFANGLESGR